MRTAAVIHRGLKAAAKAAVEAAKASADALFPLKCLACAELIGSAGETPAIEDLKGRETGRWATEPLRGFACRSCIADLRPVTPPFCDRCGDMFASRVGQNHTCETCIRAPFHFEKARSALVYTDSCARLVQAFKYKGRVQLAGPLGTILFRAFERFWSPGDFDLILPVPLHRRRMKQRGFNQVVLMLRRGARLSGRIPASGRLAPVDADLLQRVLPTTPQTGLGRDERTTNVRNAFELKSKQAVAGRRLLIVDDVYTTGTTVNECARLLLRNGAARVDVLTLARAQPP